MCEDVGVSERPVVSEFFEACVETGGELERGFVAVDSSFAAKLATEHRRTFEVEAFRSGAGSQEITASVPGVAQERLAVLDERGLVRVGRQVEPGPET